MLALLLLWTNVQRVNFAMQESRFTRDPQTYDIKGCDMLCHILSKFRLKPCGVGQAGYQESLVFLFCSLYRHCSASLTFWRQGLWREEKSACSRCVSDFNLWEENLGNFTQFNRCLTANFRTCEGRTINLQTCVHGFWMSEVRVRNFHQLDFCSSARCFG